MSSSSASSSSSSFSAAAPAVSAAEVDPFAAAAASFDSAMVDVLVVDSAAFIKGAPLERMGREIYTLHEVVSELRDERTRERLQLPQLYTLKYRDPSDEAIAAVTSFASKTGDIRSLSQVDLKVMALTWMFEKERKGGVGHLRSEPTRDVRITSRPGPIVAAHAEHSGFYFPKKAGAAASAPATTSTSTDTAVEATPATSAAAAESAPCEPTSASAPTETPVESSEDAADATTSKDASSASSAETAASNPENAEEDDDEDDDAGWITPDNIHLANKAWNSTGAATATPEQVQVGCVTTDFAMQNVLIQMGLKVISLDGMLIRRTKQFVLKCHACFRTTDNMMKEFCPSCGNPTLRKISISVNDQGVITHHESPRGQKGITRGTIYSIPLPKGGRENKDLILREDQKERIARMGYSNHQTKLDKAATAQDFIATASPFAFIDVQARSAPGAQFGYGKRNPNVAKSKTGKRKKAANTR
ncbi:ribosome biogenesis protein Nob1 [Capsaspora owczarzaki ATCC 30864]|uniref:Ribosome biogenesis protein Nob1 n=1 Tax=Capsaspora owczarzaki (strain ATCC 30864) TaxID=595528 RepID=A0A0D2WMC8_CAPO3|nr:ribosome biogenesis protein Nob1 [Capsaspora owczarzaki ATCC 30864]KJE91960.1 ribosome biogenesis protein Nob1 [Capsaspora owczarzaki ATCC 30864]|eukprot:XP_004363844.1 ribosome biogenesis protein Nob1 [Capsaspora owczarzaki ATCC 30864]